MSLSKDIMTNVFTALFGIAMLVYSLALGFGLNSIIVEFLKQQDSIHFLNSILLYYLGFEFIMRYLMQNLPVLDIQPYLHLPMKRSKMVNYLLSRSLVHLMNILVPLLFAPFAFMVIGPVFSSNIAWTWFLSLWCLSFALHLLVILFKKKLDDNLWGIIALLSIILFFGAADYFSWFKVSDLSALLFNALLQHPLFLVIPFLLVIILYVVNYKFFLQGTYPEEIAFQRGTTFNNKQDFSFLRSFGMTGELINVELKLILRNKRPRNILYLSAFFLLYGLIFYPGEKYTVGMPGMLLFVGIFITGIFMINYGQLLFSWQGSHYDFTLTRPLSMRQYVESKYWLLSGVNIVCFILSTPYAYFGWNILMMHVAMTLFNIGINTFVILNLAMWSPKKVDLKKGVTFNYEGVGAAQWVMSIPIIFGPYLFYTPFSIAGRPGLGMLAVSIAGIIGIAFRRQLIDLTTKRLMARKYSIAGGFRKD